MMKKFSILSVIFIGAELIAAWAGIPPLRVPRSVVTLRTGLNPQITQATGRLAHASVPGFGGFFNSVDRSLLIKGGTFGLNIHPIIAMHETIFPNHKKLIFPEGLADLKRLETNVPDLIASPRNENGWTIFSPNTKTLFFESALPAYLLTTTEEEIVLPSAPQLGEMLTYYRQIVGGVGTKGVFPPDYFAQQMSAVTNLGLFGTQNDAVDILRVAQTDFGSFDRFKDLFLTRSLLNLGAYDELQQLAKVRLAETDKNTKEPLLLSSVWAGVQKIALQAGKRLNIPQERISTQEDDFPPFLQREIIAHHSVNYVLGNPSVEVTQDWLALRAGLDELFNQAAAQANVKALLRQELSLPHPEDNPLRLPKKPVRTFGFASPLTVPTVTTQPVRPVSTSARAAEPQPAVADEQPAPEVPITAPTANNDDLILELPAKPKTTPAAPVAKTGKTTSVRRETVPTVQTPAKPRGNPTWKTKNTPQSVRERLENYIRENDNQLPPNNHTLRVTVYTILKKADPADSDVQAIRELWQARIKPRGWQNQKPQHHYDEIREELEEYIDVHGGLPPTESSLRKRAKYVRETGDPNDPDVQAVTELLAGHRQKNLRTPAVVRQELETYMQEHNGQLPVSNTPIRRRVDDVKTNGDPNDPDVQAIIALLTDNAIRVKRTPEKVRLELETYLKEHDGQYPPNGDPLNRAIRRLLKQNPTDENEHVAVIRALWNKHLSDVREASRQRLKTDNPAARVTGAPKPNLDPAQRAQQVREDLEQYAGEHDGQLPPDGHPLRSAAYRIKERFDPQDKNVQAIIDLLQNNKQRRGALPNSASVLADLQTYFSGHANLPEGNTALSRNVYALFNRGDKTDPNVQAITELWNSHKQDRFTPVGPVRAEFEKYLAEHDGNIPPYKHPVRVRAEYRVQTGDPNDPDVIFMRDILENQKQKKTKRTPQQVREELETYLQEHDDQLPPHASTLDQAIKAVIKREPNNPDVQMIIQLRQARQKRPNTPTPKDRSPKQVLADLEDHFRRNETLNNNRALYQAVNKLLKNGDPNDPDIQAIQKLWDTHRQNVKRTPQQVFEEVQAYYSEHGHLPSDGRALHSAANEKLNHGDPNDPYVQALKNFWQEKGTRTSAASVAKTRNELEQYLKEHDDKLPPHNTSLRIRYYRALKTGDPQDPNVAAIRKMVDERKQQRTSRSPENVFEELTQYLSGHNDQLPPHSSALYQAAAFIIKNFSNNPLAQQIKEMVTSRQQRPNRISPHDRSPKQMREDLEVYFADHDVLHPRTLLAQAARQMLRKSDPNDPDVQAVRALLDAHRQNLKRTPQSVYEETRAYFEENGHLPNDGRALHAAALWYMKKGDPDDPYIIALRNYWQEKKTRAVTTFWTEREITGETPQVPRPMSVPIAVQKQIFTPESLSEALNRFITQNGRLPSATSTDPAERNLRTTAEQLIKEALEVANIFVQTK